MTQEEFNQQQASGNVNFLPSPPVADQEPESSDTDMAQFVAVLQAIRAPRSFLTAPPTFVPKRFIDQVQFYDDATHRRVYFYFNKTWSYTTLT